ncbi:MAG: 3'-5' exonuclease [Candidatus Margulisiibacteriota bacterium]
MEKYYQSPEFSKLTEKYPFLRHASEEPAGLLGQRYCVIDIETTGLEYQKSEIIEIAAARIEGGQTTETYNVLINTHQLLPDNIMNLTGITQELHDAGVEKRVALDGFYTFINNDPLVVHNVEFDVPFINHHAQLLFIPHLANQLLCTLKLSRKLIPGLYSYKLSKVAEHFRIPTPVLHRAAADVEITGAIWLKLIALLENKGIQTVAAAEKFWKS